jgi:hypothetical protein
MSRQATEEKLTKTHNYYLLTDTGRYTREREKKNSNEERKVCISMINDVNATLEDSCGDNLNGVDRFGNGEKTNFSLDVEMTTANMDVGSSSEFAASQESPTAPVPPERRHVSDTREGSCGDNRNGDDSWNDNETGVEEKMGSPDIESTTQDSTTTVVSQEISPPPPPSRNCCGRMWHYGDSGNMSEARGYALLAMGMS